MIYHVPSFVVLQSLLQQPHSRACSTLHTLDEPKFRESAKDKAARSITTSKVHPFAFEIQLLRSVILILLFYRGVWSCCFCCL